jgi:hypothetical protein
MSFASNRPSVSFASGDVAAATAGAEAEGDAASAEDDDDVCSVAVSDESEDEDSDYEVSSDSLRLHSVSLVGSLISQAARAEGLDDEEPEEDEEEGKEDDAAFGENARWTEHEAWAFAQSVLASERSADRSPFLPNVPEVVAPPAHVAVPPPRPQRHRRGPSPPSAVEVYASAKRGLAARAVASNPMMPTLDELLKTRVASDDLGGKVSARYSGKRLPKLDARHRIPQVAAQ